jgi:cytochrome c oxidase cbb3-type subunit 3
MSEQRERDDVSGRDTTGHEWDGIKELDTPLPRWWLYVFYATILVSVVYWVLMPSWPLPNGYTPGILGFSDRRNVVHDVDAMRAARAPSFARLQKATYAEVVGDPELSAFARAAGETVFADNCRTCHGAGGAGAPGYPNLADDVWLWGGSLEEIEHTIRVGVRSGHQDARFSQMPAYGRDQLLTPREITDVTEYVLSLSPIRDRTHPEPGAARRGAVVFQAQCVACHGPDAHGNRALGAPSLVDDVWLYGGTRAEVRKQVDQGRNGVMPTWEARFDSPTIRALAVYVYSLGGGEPSAPPAPAVTPTSATPPTPAPAPTTP